MEVWRTDRTDRHDPRMRDWPREIFLDLEPDVRVRFKAGKGSHRHR